MPETEIFLLGNNAEYCCLAGDLMEISTALASQQCPPPPPTTPPPQQQQQQQPQPQPDQGLRSDDSGIIPAERQDVQEPEPRVYFYWQQSIF